MKRKNQLGDKKIYIEHNLTVEEREVQKKMVEQGEGKLQENERKRQMV